MSENNLFNRKICIQFLLCVKKFSVNNNHLIQTKLMFDHKLWGRERTPLSFLQKFEHRLMLPSNNYHCFVARRQKILSMQTTRYLNHALILVFYFLIYLLFSCWILCLERDWMIRTNKKEREWIYLAEPRHKRHKVFT